MYIYIPQNQVHKSEYIHTHDRNMHAVLDMIPHTSPSCSSVHSLAVEDHLIEGDW